MNVRNIAGGINEGVISFKHDFTIKKKTKRELHLQTLINPATQSVGISGNERSMEVLQYLKTSFCNYVKPLWKCLFQRFSLPLGGERSSAIPFTIASVLGKLFFSAMLEQFALFLFRLRRLRWLWFRQHWTYFYAAFVIRCQSGVMKGENNANIVVKLVTYTLLFVD